MSTWRLWNATLCFSKLSILSMYAALIAMSSMLQWVRILGALVVTWNVANILAGFLECRLHPKDWNFT
jgi:hypothetical protein